MKTGIIIHGTPDEEEYYSDIYPSPSNSNWLPWLQKQMLMADILTQTPEMPEAAYPRYDAWKRTLECFPLNEESIFIGHSCGGGFLLRYLSEHADKKIKRLILVAPWLDPHQEKDPDFFQFKIDPELSARTDIHLFHSDNDEADVQESVSMIKKELPNIKEHGFHGYGHFCLEDMKTEKFPELRDVVLA